MLTFCCDSIWGKLSHTVENLPSNIIYRLFRPIKYIYIYQNIFLANKYELQLALNLTFIKTALNTFQPFFVKINLPYIGEPHFNIS